MKSKICLIFVLLVAVVIMFFAFSCKNTNQEANVQSKAVSSNYAAIKSGFEKLAPITDKMLTDYTSVQQVNSQGEVVVVSNEYTYNLDAFKTLPDGIPSCNKGTKKVAELSDAELKLIYGTRITVDGKDKYRNSLHLLWSDYLQFYSKNGHPPKDLIELYGFSDSWQETILAKTENDPLILSRFFSPITYEPLDFNYSEFNPGQIYITPITDPDSPLLNYPNPDNTKRKLGKDLFALYVRVYGEDKVIYETSVIAPIGAIPPAY